MYVTDDGIPRCVYLGDMCQKFISEHNIENIWKDTVVEMTVKNSTSKYTCEDCNYSTNYKHNLKTHQEVWLHFFIIMFYWLVAPSFKKNVFL